MPPSAILIALLVAAAALAQNPTPTADTAAGHYPYTPPHTPTSPTTPNATPTPERQEPLVILRYPLDCKCQVKIPGCDIALDPDPAYKTNLTISNPHRLPITIYARNCRCDVSITTTIHICYTTETQILLEPANGTKVQDLSIITPNKILLRGQKEVHVDVTPITLTIPVALIGLASLAIPLIVNSFRFSRPVRPNLRLEEKILTGYRRKVKLTFAILKRQQLQLSLILLALFAFLSIFLYLIVTLLTSLLYMTIVEFTLYMIINLFALIAYVFILHYVVHAARKLQSWHILVKLSLIAILVIIFLSVMSFLRHELNPLGPFMYVVYTFAYAITLLIAPLVMREHIAALSLVYFIAGFSLLLFFILILYVLYLSYLIITMIYLLHYKLFDLPSLVLHLAAITIQIPLIIAILSAYARTYPRFLSPITRIIAAVFPFYAEELAARAKLALQSMKDLVEVSVRTSYGEWRGVVEYADAMELRIQSEGRSLNFRLDDVDIVEILKVYEPNVRFKEIGGGTGKRSETDIIVYGGSVLGSVSPDKIIVEVRKGYDRMFHDGSIPLVFESRDGEMIIEVRRNAVQPSGYMSSSGASQTQRSLRIGFDESAPKGICVTVEFKGLQENFTVCNV